METIYRVIGQGGFGALIGFIAGSIFTYCMLKSRSTFNQFYLMGQEHMRERAAKLAHERAKERENPKNTADKICALELLDL
jgi:hypothetical protein